MSKCLKCDRPVNDAFCCVTCAGEARKHLATIAYLTAHADEKRARIGSNAISNSSDGGRAAETPLPYDPRVSKVLNPIRIALHGTARMVLETAPEDVGDDSSPVASSLASVADWLIQFCDWLRRQDCAAEEFATFERAAVNVTALFDRPPDKLFMGTCEALDPDGSGIECGEWLYVETNSKGEADAAAINCPRCKAVHEVAKHRTEILGRLAGYQATTREISNMCRSMIDGDVSVRMLQIYAKHGFLMSHGTRLERDKMGRYRKVATYRIGDVEPAVDLWKNYLTEQRDKKRRHRSAA